MLRRTCLIVLVTASLTSIAVLRAQEAPRYAGATRTGFLLPNGWTVTPVGEQVPVADLPLNILPLPDSRHVLVATSGYNAHELSLIDLEKKAVVDRQTVRESWFGLAASTRLRSYLVVRRRSQCRSPVRARRREADPQGD